MTGPFSHNLEDHTLLSDPLRNFKFVVEFLEKDTSTSPKKLFPVKLGFMSVSGLSVTTENIAYREGGYNTTVHQIPGMTSFTPVTFSRGVTIGTDQHHKWMRRLFSTTLNSAEGGIGTNFRAHIDISVLGHPNAAGWAAANQQTPAGSPEETYVAMKFRLYNAWITNLSYSDLNAGAHDILVEQMTVVHEGFDIKWANSLNTDPESLDY